jgi:CO/xanthine dehydrogenase Mo-binding subunit/aerobic-type carbon monoxide dehydrogenase small subunit (CoxS/CutS family)
MKYMSRVRVSFELNGIETAVESEANRTLLDVLRNDLGLTGTKKGCDAEGRCGGCTVIIDGKAKRACRTSIEDVRQKRVFSIEGVALCDALHPLQQAFIDCGAVQCGYCTPGMILSAKALLDSNPNPSRAEILHAIQGNLCRCTGYTKIIDAIARAADVLRGDPSSNPPTRSEFTLIGEDLRRLDSLGRVTGSSQFAGDITLPNMLHVKVIRSKHALAWIKSIDARAALRIPGVKAVITAKDIHGVKSFSDLWGSKNDNVSTKDHPTTAVEPLLAEDLVRMVGEPVALVAGCDEESALAGSEAVQIEYEVLEPVYDPEQALKETAFRLHPGGNLYEYGEIKKEGPPDLAEDAQVKVELDFSLASQDHVALEPVSSVAYIDESGRLVVVGPSHQPHARKEQIARMLDIDPERVRVIIPPVGGSFGSKHHFWPLLAVALPAYLLRQPVKLVYTRAEVFEAGLKRHAFKFKYRITANQDGRLTRLHMRGFGNAGPYGGAPTIGEFVALCGAGPYDWPAIDSEVRVAHTNWANAGPFRGYGMPHGVLGLECTLDELARQANIDPLELRYLNAIEPGEISAGGQPFDEPFGFTKVLDALRPRWLALRQSTKELQANSPAHERYGIGMAANWYQYGKSGEQRTNAQAGLDENGKIVLYYTAYTAGAGSDTVMGQIASQELGIPRSEIAFVNNDTDQTLDSKITGACRTTYWVGGAVQKAVQALREEIYATAVELLKVPEDSLRLTGKEVYDSTRPSESVSLSEIAALWRRNGKSAVFTGTLDLEGRYPQRDPRFMLTGNFVCGAAIAQVRLDTHTGKIKVLKVVVAQDVGRALNPMDLEGQIEGAVLMELGSVLMEEHIPGQTLDFKSYNIPRAKDAPAVESILVEVEGSEGPYGAKGVGEAVMGHSRAAMLNAICDASGRRITRLPVTPARLLKALQEG